MKVLLLKDVYKLGRAGDIKKVADGYGRNYLIPQGLATLATSSALQMAEHIRVQAAETRAVLNKELGGVADQIARLTLTFPAKAGETGKLYGSITPQMLTDAIRQKIGFEVDRRQIDSQPIRALGIHRVRIRLTLDLIPEIQVIVHREGETPEQVLAEAARETIEAAEQTSALETPTEAIAQPDGQTEPEQQEAAPEEA